MTSRRGISGKYSADELDGLIRWALQERVAGNSPPPEMYERICALAKRHAPWHLMGRGISRACWAVADQLSNVDAFLSAQMPFWIRPQRGWTEWRWDPRFTCLLDQYGFLLQLAF